MYCIVGRHGRCYDGATTITFHRDSQTVVLTDVPADVCENCGEAYLSETNAARAHDIAARARESGVRLLLQDFGPAG